MTEEAERIVTDDGLTLETAYDGEASAARIVVLCHPHPKMGGTMNAPLILALRDALVERGWGVLRFNFRGIGASEGESSDGIAETADARGAIAHALARQSDALVALAGWSFGGAVALRVASDNPAVGGCVAIAPAVESKLGVTAGAPPAVEFREPGPTLVVCGANDDQVSPAACRSWAAAAGVAYEEVKGANHFFWAKYDTLCELVAGFLESEVRS